MHRKKGRNILRETITRGGTRVAGSGLACVALFGCEAAARSATGGELYARTQTPTSTAYVHEDDGSAGPKYREAVSMYAAGRYEASVRLLRLHVIRYPRHYHGTVLLARALLHMGQAAEAARVLQDADLSGVDSQRLLIEALLLDGRPEEALAALHVGMEHNGEDPRLLILLARIYRNAGSYARARSLYRRALVFRGELGVAARELAELHALEGSSGQAAEWRELSRRLLPEPFGDPVPGESDTDQCVVGR